LGYCCYSPQISSSTLAETAAHNAQSVKTESTTVKMKEEVKPSSNNEWVTFIVFHSSFSSPQISSTSSRNPQPTIRNAQMEQQNRLTETRRKRQSISHTALRRSTTAKSPGYRDGYEKVRSVTFKGIRKGINGC
jgi:hypothetical protein